MKPLLSLLSHAGIIGQIFATSASGLPLHAYVKEHRFKILFLDIGLLQTACHVDADELFKKDILQINAGMLAEQFVGQELLAKMPVDLNRPLLFWEKEGSSQAEIDYVIASDSKILPIEVKAGSTGRLKSMQIFLELKQSPLGIRIAEFPLSLHQRILSLPFYAIFNFEILIRESLS